MKRPSVDLLKKYNVQGPRYTSYPPAPSWSDAFGPVDYESLIAQSQRENPKKPVSLYLHLPFCEALCYFCGCTTVITGENHRPESPYVKSLLWEIEWLGKKVSKERPVVQLHLGGGTPTYFSPENLQAIMKGIRTHFNISPDVEAGIEVDPRVTTIEHLQILREAGFNRLSMGVQDFNPTVQRAIHREQSPESTEALIQKGKELGFQSVNVDLIFGLPFQTPETFSQTINKIIDIGPDRLAVYSYAHVPWMKKYQSKLEPHLPNETQKFEIFLTALDLFTKAGFEYIGMDHFARPEDELSRAREDRTLWRNFMGYTTKSGTDLFGLGMSAIGRIGKGYMQNLRTLRDYQMRISVAEPATMRGFICSEDDLLRERIIQNLLCHGVVVKSEIEKEFGIEFDKTFQSALENLRGPIADGLIEISKDELRPTSLGRLFLRNLAMPFDAYLPKDKKNMVFSRTI